MITGFKFNSYDILADDRTYIQIDGLGIPDRNVSTTLIAGTKYIQSSTLDNRTIKIQGTILYDVEAFCQNLTYSLMPSSTSNYISFSIYTDTNPDTYYTISGIVQDIEINRYKHPMTYSISIVCKEPYFCKKSVYYKNNTADNVTCTREPFDDCSKKIKQDRLTVTHTVQSGETQFSIAFSSTPTIVKYDADYTNYTLEIDLEDKQAKLRSRLGITKEAFFMVSQWDSGSSYYNTFTLPPYTTITFQEKTLEVW